MANNMNWAEWQKEVIKGEYDDIKSIIAIRDQAQRLGNLTAKKTLAKVQRHGN